VTAEAANEALAQRWHMDIFDAGKLEVAEEILGPDFVFHMPGQDIRGADEVQQLAAAMRAAFPDMQITHEDVLAAGNQVVIRWTARGTHQGTYLPPWEVPPTGREIKMRGIDWYQVVEGKIAEAWIEIDELGMLRQMGAVQEPGQPRE
jgi:steroid delta-isomerase-like uncharacterized protein